MTLTEEGQLSLFSYDSAFGAFKGLGVLCCAVLSRGLASSLVSLNAKPLN